MEFVGDLHDRLHVGGGLRETHDGGTADEIRGIVPVQVDLAGAVTHLIGSEPLAEPGDEGCRHRGAWRSLGRITITRPLSTGTPST